MKGAVMEVFYASVQADRVTAENNTSVLVSPEKMAIQVLTHDNDLSDRKKMFTVPIYLLVHLFLIVVFFTFYTLFQKMALTYTFYGG
jgi:hypothetical protein